MKAYLDKSGLQKKARQIVSSDEEEEEELPELDQAGAEAGAGPSGGNTDLYPVGSWVVAVYKAESLAGWYVAQVEGERAGGGGGRVHAAQLHGEVWLQSVPLGQEEGCSEDQEQRHPPQDRSAHSRLFLLHGTAQEPC